MDLDYKPDHSFFLIIMILCLSAGASYGQESGNAGDSAMQSKRNPKTAVICSLVLPGLGQVYNRKYWKVPLIYGAGGAAFYSFNYYYTRYKKIMEFMNEDDARKTYVFHGIEIKNKDLPLYRDHYRYY